MPGVMHSIHIISYRTKIGPKHIGGLLKRIFQEFILLFFKVITFHMFTKLSSLVQRISELSRGLLDGFLIYYGTLNIPYRNANSVRQLARFGFCPTHSLPYR